MTSGYHPYPDGVPPGSTHRRLLICPRPPGRGHISRTTGLAHLSTTAVATDFYRRSEPFPLLPATPLGVPGPFQRDHARRCRLPPGAVTEPVPGDRLRGSW